MNAIRYRYSALTFLVLLIISSILTGCPATTMSTSEAGRIEGLFTQAPGGADDFIIVDCRLPGQIRQLGQRMVYLSRGPSEKTTAIDCARRGGEFAIPGQTEYKKALLVWMPDAKAGDKIAQNYVGEIYQRGTGGSPQYTLAAEWFRKAAEQGLTRAQMNLAYLYDKGLGVEKDPRQAQSWYRRATGLGDAVSLDENALSFEERQELQQLREEVNRRSQESKQLRQKLEQTQKDLEDIRRKLKQRSSEAKSQAQRQDVAGLTTQVARYEEMIVKLREQMAEDEALIQKLPAPRIEVYDDAPVLRGVRLDAGRPDSKKRQIAGMVWAPAGLQSFKVNQQTQKVKADGKFRVSVSLNPAGGTEVEMIAVDLRGKSTRIIHILAPSPASGPDGLNLAAYKNINYGRYHALIIGNIDYKRLPPLQTAVNDARDIDAILRDKYGFGTTLLLNAKRFDIMQALNQFKENLTNNDNFLIYYAGHGIRDANNNIGYWQPVDADRSRTTNWIANQDVTSLLNNMKAKHVLIVADSCYAGTFLRGVAEQGPPTAPDAQLDYFKEIAKARARKVLTSGELEPVLDSGPGGHSVFANVLLDVLKANDRVIDGDSLHQELVARVVSDSKRFGKAQMPLYNGNIQAGDGRGDFIFVPTKFQ